MKLACSGVAVTYRSNGNAVEAIRDISFRAGDREFLAVVGPSGCGKTTLLRVLAGLLPPTSGDVRRTPAPDDPSDRVLMVFQEHNLFPWMTVLQNAAFGLEMQRAPKAGRERRALEVLRRFGLEGREQAYPHELSVGMKQRVAVIRSFLSEPAVLLMDEPFGGLDVQTRLELQRELLSLWEQSHRTIVFVTHDVGEALLLSDRVLVLSAQPSIVAAEFTVPFPRPRSGAVIWDPEFISLSHRICVELGMEPPPSAAPVAGGADAR